jgi:hypothetical protein
MDTIITEEQAMQGSEVARSPRRYHYATVRADALFLLTKVPIPKDSYVSNDEETKAVRKLLAAGYRWIRTDGEWAVFEKGLK